MEGNTTDKVKMEDVDAEKFKVFVKEELHASNDELLQASKDELLQASKEELQQEEEEDADNLFVQTGDVKVEISETNGKFNQFVFQTLMLKTLNFLLFLASAFIFTHLVGEGGGELNVKKQGCIFFLENYFPSSSFENGFFPKVFVMFFSFFLSLNWGK